MRRTRQSSEHVGLYGDKRSHVAQNLAQEPIFYYYGQIYIGGSFKAFWAMGESLGSDTFIQKSPREYKYL